ALRGGDDCELDAARRVAGDIEARHVRGRIVSRSGDAALGQVAAKALDQRRTLTLLDADEESPAGKQFARREHNLLQFAIALEPLDRLFAESNPDAKAPVTIPVIEDAWPVGAED